MWCRHISTLHLAWIFFPVVRIYTYVRSTRATFLGAPLSLCLLLRGQAWWDKHTWRAASGNTINDIIMITQKPSNLGQSRDWTDSNAGPPLNLDCIWSVANHTPSVLMCMSSWRPECQIPVWDHRSCLWISLLRGTEGALPLQCLQSKGIPIYSTFVPMRSPTST